MVLLSLMTFAALTMSQCVKNDSSSSDRGHNNTIDTTGSTDEYVDLGLRSMTLWKKTNEENTAEFSNGFYTYDEAVAAFGNNLPTMEQFEELLQSCQWNWVDAGYYIVVGRNKKYITLPANGFCDCMGDFCYPRTYGFYWSSTPAGAEKAWYLNFYSNEAYLYKDNRCFANSVRLVKNN
ncbi:MAG: hypothetical protein J6X59_00945 [Bacteroidales bacterium]|nr:hypothetical protein [Bacteroidales bacterium]